jgi:hypothetical protein
MIVQATQRKTIDVEIDPVSVIHDMEESWKVMCRLPIDAELRAGYWTQGGSGFAESTRLRIATQREMLIYNAFETMREVANYFE